MIRLTPDASVTSPTAQSPSDALTAARAAAAAFPSEGAETRPMRMAATVVLLRDGAHGLEVLLLRRAERGDLNSGAWVFPGGVVDAQDAHLHGWVTDLDDATASSELDLPSGGLNFVIAALRECFEEAGVLYAQDGQGQSAHWDAMDPATRQSMQDWRHRLNHHEVDFAAFCNEHGWRLRARDVVYLSHWITPPGRAKRFDTRFFIAAMPAGQSATPDTTEVVEQRWLRPEDAVSREAALKLMTPTEKTLQALRAHATVADAMTWARSQRRREPICPHVGVGSQGPRPVLPDEPSWAELRYMDPQGRGDGSYEIVPMKAVHLSAHVVRVTASNGSVMTGPGTNSYFIGGGPANEWVLLDPGPAEATHIQALLAAAPGRVTRMLVTHTHTDHSPAAALLREHFPGVPLLGRRPDHPEWQDADFAPDDLLHGGERLSLVDGAVTLRVIHTPGHASNHLCYLFEEARILFTGDHVMQGSTVVINPPDGDMQAYLQSLTSLRDDPGPTLAWIAPGHGFLIPQPARAFDTLIRHRLQREAKTLRCLTELQAERSDLDGAVPLESLLDRVYDDVPAARRHIARRSLLAHLGKLVADGRVRGAGEDWRAS